MPESDKFEMGVDSPFKVPLFEEIDVQVGPSDGLESYLYPYVRAAVLETPWAILPGKLAQIVELVELRGQGIRFSAEEIQQRIGAARPRQTAPAGSSIAVLPVFGTISHRMNMMGAMSGGTSTELLARDFRQLLADESIGTILLDIDSPGGSVEGVPELAAEIFASRGTKPIVAHANALAASAAYWIGTAADELIVTPSGEVGSIGVVAAHVDASGWYEQTGQKITLLSAGKFKTEGNPYEPLGDEARAAFQARIDDYYSMFVSAVAKHRGVSTSDVRGGFGEGRVVGAKEAVRLGMADRVESFSDTVRRLARGGSGSRSRSAAGEIPAATADSDGDLDWRERRARLYGAGASTAFGKDGQ